MGIEMDDLSPVEEDPGQEELTREGQTRRAFLGMVGVASGLVALSACSRIGNALGLGAEEEKNSTMSIEEQRRRIADINAKNPTALTQWSSKLIVENLTEGMEGAEARRKLFEFVRDFPYKITPYDPSREGIGLYDHEHGDCRHKRDALFALFQSLGLEVRKVAVPFDWKDLPIPKEILDIRKVSGTKAFHSGMEVKLEGKWIYVDPTWDIGLKGSGFPITENWDGKSPTKDATFGQCPRIPHEEYESMDELHRKFNIRYPVRSENEAFVQALNEWIAKEQK